MDKNINLDNVSLSTLDDSKTLKALLQSQAHAIANRLSEAQRKNVSREEVIDTDKKAAALMAATLLGKNPAFKEAEENTPAKFEKNIRNGLQEELKQTGLSESDLQDQTALFQIASFIFSNEVHELIKKLSQNPDTIETSGPAELNKLLDRWCSLLEEK